jgi:hypothetical protein
LEGTDDVTWGMEKFNNNIFFSTADVKGENGKQYLISVIDDEITVRQKELFKIDEEIDLSRYGFEFSEYDLRKYIQKIIAQTD